MREFATQAWPETKVMLMAVSLAASSMSASSKMIVGDLPPSLDENVRKLFE